MSVRNIRRRLLGGLFDLIYRLGRWVYDPLTRVFFGREWHRWRQTILPWVSGRRTLEIGCGTGELLEDLAERSPIVVGMDLSASMLAPARAEARGVGAALVRGSGRTLPFRDDTFDTVVTTFPAGYIARPDTLDEIARVLRPGGHFLAVVSARFTRFQWRRPFIHPILRVAYGSSHSMNRLPQDWLGHRSMPGCWHALPTPEGEAFVWIAQRSSQSERRKTTGSG